MGLPDRVAVVAVGEAKDNVAVSNGVNFVDVEIGAQDIELFKQTLQHSDYILRLFSILRAVRKLSEALDVREQNGALLEEISQLQSILEVLRFQLLVGVLGE